MRLICPNCGAQYEVDARVIPDTGRDVQCSNCGHTWFQQPAHLDTELAQEQGYELSNESDEAAPPPDAPENDMPETPDAETPDIPAEPEQHPDPTQSLVADLVNEPEAVEEPADDDAQEPEPEITFEHHGTVPEPSPQADPELEFDEEPEYEPELDAEPEEDPEPPHTPAPTGLKDSVRDILRAEVEFDQSMRQPDNEVIETQTDLGLEEPDQDAAKKSLRDRMARLRGLDPADPGIAAGSVAAASGKRRDLLPDIEEINSTLSASSERDEDGTVPDEDTRRARAERSGFRTGFTLLILIAAMLVGLYVLAPVIAEKVPALAEVMDSYVVMANDFRAWLDWLMNAASERMTALLSQLGG